MSSQSLNGPSMTGTQDKASFGTSGNKKPKLMVNFNDEGSVVGENAKHFQTRAGEFVRALLPISYNEISDVPPNFKDDVWNALLNEFEFEIPSTVARDVIEPTWSQKFRSYKNSLRKELSLNPDLQPKGVDPIIWKTFLSNESDPKKITERLRNKVSRGTLEYSHTLGRQTYAQKQHTLEKKDPGKEIQPQDVWLVGHERNDGTVLASAKPKHEAVSAASKNSKDPMAVLGPNKKGGVRGKGSYITKKKLQHSAVARAKIAQMKDKQLADQSEVIDKMSLELAEIKATLKSLLKMLPPPILDSSPSNNITSNENGEPANVNESTPDANTIPTSEKGTTSNNAHSTSRNLESMFTSKDIARADSNAPIRVNLCNLIGKPVARGTLVTDHTAGTCHFKKVGNHEKKVSIEEVLIPDTRIFGAPQNGNYTLHDYVSGGFIIWPNSHIDYI